MAALLAPQIKFRYTDDNGNPLAGGKVFTYISGTSTPLETWSDPSGTLNTNPVILDSRGEADIYLVVGKGYKFVVKSAADVTIETIEGIYGSSPAGSSEWMNVKAFGAVGDGIEDDTAAIQDAIDSAEALGGTLYFPAGDYKVTSALVLSKPLVVLGDGFESKLIQATSTENLWEAAANISGAVFEKMFWQGAGDGLGTNSCAFYGYTGGANVSITFRDLKIELFPEAGLYLPDSYCNSISKCIIRRCGTVGTIAGGNADACTDSFGGGIRYGKITFTGSACTGNSLVSTYISRCGRGVYVDSNERVVSHEFIDTKVELCYIGIDIDGRGSSTTLSRFNSLGASTYFEANKFAGALMGEGTITNTYQNDTTPGTGLPGSTSTSGPDGVVFTGRYNRFTDSSVRIGNELATNPIAFAIDKSNTTNYISSMRVFRDGALTLVEDADTPANETVSLFAGSGNPEASVAAQTGSLYLRHNGSELGNTMYLKITGDGTNTGWRSMGPMYGATADRPTPDAVNKGSQYYDTDILRVVTSSGSIWREYNGLTTVRDTLANVPSHFEGAQFYATDRDAVLVSDGGKWNTIYVKPVFVSAGDGLTTTISARGGLVVNTNTSTIATHTVVLPNGAGADTGDRVEFATDGAITALTVSAGADTVRRAPTTLAAGSSFEFVYNRSASTWYRVR